MLLLPIIIVFLECLPCYSFSSPITSTGISSSKRNECHGVTWCQRQIVISGRANSAAHMPISIIERSFLSPLSLIQLDKRNDIRSQNFLRSSTRGEVELYNEQGEEIDVDISMDIDLDTIGGDLGVENNVSEKESKKLIECSAKISLPFSADVAFDAFSDLTRQPSWCKYLHSVEYLGLVGDGNDNTSVNLDGKEESILQHQKVPLRKSKWTVGVKGFRFSWTANDTRIERPHRIEWESTTGMKNRGSVEFIPVQPPSSSECNNPTTQMILCFTFTTPRVVASLFRRSGYIRQYTEDVLLMNMLNDFRNVVIEEDL